MIKKILKILGVLALGMAGGIFTLQIWSYFNQSQQPIYVTEKTEVIIRENTALENAVEKSEKMVIGVRAIAKAGKILEGSGLIITSDGLAVTLAELVPQGSAFYFYIDGRPVSYQILKRDLKENLALIKLGQNNLPTVGFAPFEKISLGEEVFLIGLVFKDEIPKSVINEGIIRSFGENYIYYTNIFEKSELKGSALFDIEGNVLGLNTINKEGRIVSISAKKIKEFSGL